RTRLVRLVAVPDPELELDLAPVPLSADVGCLRRLDLLYRFGFVLVHGLDSGPGGAPGPGQEPPAPVPLRFVRPGLDRLEPPLEQLREGLLDPGRPVHSAGPLGPFDCVSRFLG